MNEHKAKLVSLGCAPDQCDQLETKCKAMGFSLSGLLALLTDPAVLSILEAIISKLKAQTP